MIEQELLANFQNLDKNEKRNQISSEIENLAMLLDAIHKEYNIQKLPSSVYEYNKATDSEMSDDEYYNKMYESIIFLRKDILTLVNSFMKK